MGHLLHELVRELPQRCEGRIHDQRAYRWVPVRAPSLSEAVYVCTVQLAGRIRAEVSAYSLCPQPRKRGVTGERTGWHIAAR